MASNQRSCKFPVGEGHRRRFVRVIDPNHYIATARQVFGEEGVIRECARVAGGQKDHGMGSLGDRCVQATVSRNRKLLYSYQLREETPHSGRSIFRELAVTGPVT